MSNLTPSEITRVKDAIHNSADPRHFMKLKPVDRRIRISHEGIVLAQSQNALRVLEVGHDLYDPAFYVPKSDVVVSLRLSQTTSNCPLKGDAQYYDLIDDQGTVIETDIAWTYTKPYMFAQPLTDHVAFVASHVSIEEAPL